MRCPARSLKGSFFCARSFNEVGKNGEKKKEEKNVFPKSWEGVTEEPRAYDVRLVCHSANYMPGFWVMNSGDATLNSF